MKPRCTILALCVFCFTLVSAELASQDRPSSISSSLFSQADSSLKLTLRLDLDHLLNESAKKKENHRAQIGYWNIASQESVHVNLKLQSRGNYRRRKENCDFPPLEFDFPKTKLEGTIFDGENKLKVVTHCRSKDDRYEDYILQEFLLYRSYNLLTAHSFRVRLLHVTYQDSVEPSRSFTRRAFLIEDQDALAGRLGGKILKKDGLSNQEMDQQGLALLYLFQYVIGNIDWSIEARQNLKLLDLDSPDGLFALPYDFDFAQIISPHYIDRAPKLGPETLRHQLFHDLCLSPKELDPIIDRIQDAQGQIHQLISSAKYLDEQLKSKLDRQFSNFYNTLEDENLVQKEFIRPCTKTHQVDP